MECRLALGDIVEVQAIRKCLLARSRHVRRRSGIQSAAGGPTDTLSSADDVKIDPLRKRHTQGIVRRLMLPDLIEIVPPSRRTDANRRPAGLEEPHQSRPDSGSSSEQSHSPARCPLERGHAGDGGLSRSDWDSALKWRMIRPNRATERSRFTDAAEEFPNAGTPAQTLELFVENAGTAARFLPPFLCLGQGTYRVSGVPRMHERPQASLIQALRELGSSHRQRKQTASLPSLHGTGPRHAATCSVSVEESSQFASGLLLSERIGGWKVRVTGGNDEELPYVDNGHDAW